MAVLFVLTMLVVPIAAETPVRGMLISGGFTGEHSYEICLGLTAAGFLLLANRRRLRDRRRQRREAKQAWRERERLRNSYVLNLSPYEYEEYVA